MGRPLGRPFEQPFSFESIFMDVDSINLGEDFVKAIVKTLVSCDVLIAVIGKSWVSSSDQEGQRRLENSEHYVRGARATGGSTPFA